MNLDQGKISWSQYIFLFFGFINSISLIFLPAAGAKHLVWLAVLGAMLEGLIYVYVYVSLALMFPEKTFFEMNDVIFGPYAGKLISASYLWFFLLSTALNLRVFGNFFTLIYTETPLVVFLILTILICAMAVRRGIEVIARCAALLVPIVITFALISFFVLIKDMTLSNLLPLDVPLKSFLQATQAVTSFLFGETIVFIMLIPHLNDIRKAKKSALPVILASVFLVIAEIINTAVLGGIAEIVAYPSYQASRLVNIGTVLTRFEIIVAINFLLMGFLRVSAFYYGFVLGTAQLFKLRSYTPLIYPLAAIITCLSIINFENVYEDFDFAVYYFPVYSFPFQVGLPLLALIIALLRGLHRKGR